MVDCIGEHSHEILSMAHCASISQGGQREQSNARSIAMCSYAFFIPALHVTHSVPCPAESETVAREDPSIFGYNLMNEPRSQEELYIIQRVTTDDLALPYNISYNQGNDLQQWVENMAGYVKSIDPVHLLTIGNERRRCI